MKKIILILFVMLTISLGTFAKKHKPQREEVSTSSLDLKGKKNKQGECTSGLIMEGGKIIGYWIMCDGILWITWY